MNQTDLSIIVGNIRSSREDDDFWGVWSAYLELPAEQRHNYAALAGVYGEEDASMWAAYDRVAEAARDVLAHSHRCDLVQELVRRASLLWVQGGREFIRDIFRYTLQGETWTLDEVERPDLSTQLATLTMPRPARVDYAARPPLAPWQARAWTQQWDGGWGIDLRPNGEDGTFNAPVVLADEYGRQIIALPFGHDKSKALIWSRYKMFSSKVAEIVGDDGRLIATISQGAWTWPEWEPGANLPLLKISGPHSDLVASYGGQPRWSPDVLVVDYTTVVAYSRQRESELLEARRDVLGHLFEGRVHMGWHSGQRLQALSHPASSYEGMQGHLERVVGLLKGAQPQLLAVW